MFNRRLKQALTGAASPVFRPYIHSRYGWLMTFLALELPDGQVRRLMAGEVTGLTEG